MCYKPKSKKNNNSQKNGKKMGFSKNISNEIVKEVKLRKLNNFLKNLKSETTDLNNLRNINEIEQLIKTKSINFEDISSKYPNIYQKFNLYLNKKGGKNYNIGMKKIGNDKNIWIVSERKNKIKYWKKVL